MKLTLILLAVVAVGQLGIPGYMIHRQEQTLREGRAYKFKTAPVDPYDAFRGRYVALRYAQDHAAWTGTNVVRRMPAFATVVEGTDGFAVVSELALTRPAAGDFLRVMVHYSGWGTNAGMAYFTLPFDRYYMEETKAPMAERAYWDNNRRGQTNLNTYALVRIRQGHGVLEELFVDGRPIRDVVRERQKEP
ncbi:MAG: hypothetical protein PCFJNLEI_03914 [Verrucomicrobiae bacterium]|nr:hypothetical protein [Verrucomicrobiae bacterium]